jgi:hypothetical protein
MVQIVCFNALNNKIYFPASCLAQIPPIAEYICYLYNGILIMGEEEVLFQSLV